MDVTTDSTFPEDEMVKEKGVVCGEIDMNEDNFPRKAYHVCMQSMYDGHPAGEPVIGTKEMVQGLSRNDLLSYIKDRYHAKNMMVVCAGGGVTKKTHGVLRRAFASVPEKGRKVVAPRFVKQAQTQPAITIHKKKTDQIHVAVGLPAVPVSHKDADVLFVIKSLLASGFSSRLWIRLREEMGAGYYVNAHHIGFIKTGNFMIRTGTNKKQLGDVIGAITEELGVLRSVLVQPKELARVKKAQAANMVMGLETPEAYSDYYGFQAIYPGHDVRTPSQQLGAIKKVTAKDIQRFAKKYFKKENVHIAVVGDVAPNTKLEKYIKL